MTPPTIKPAPALEPLLSIEDAARALNCSRRTIEAMRAGGRFAPADCHIGRSPRWRRSTVDAWINAGGTK